MRRLLWLMVIGAILLPATTHSTHAQDECAGQPTPRLNQTLTAVVIGDEPIDLFRTPDFPRSSAELAPGTIVRATDKPICADGRYMIQVGGNGVYGWVEEQQLEPMSDLDLPTDLLFIGETNIETPDLSFSYDLSLGSRVLVQRKDADQLVITFLDYPNMRVFDTPQIVIYPTDNYTGSFPDAAAARYTELQPILETRPPLNTTTEEFPVLPAFSSSQEFLSRGEYIDGAGFSGLRFVTRYTQSFVPLVGDDLQFVVQGTLQDGALFMYAFLPMQAEGIDLPDFEETVGFGDMEELDANYDAYLLAGAIQIDVLPDEAFSPPLTALDSILASLVVSTPRSELPFRSTPNFMCGDGMTSFYRDQNVITSSDGVSEGVPATEANTRPIDNTLPLRLSYPYCNDGIAYWWAIQGDVRGFVAATTLSPMQ